MNPLTKLTTITVCTCPSVHKRNNFKCKLGKRATLISYDGIKWVLDEKRELKSRCNKAARLAIKAGHPNNVAATTLWTIHNTHEACYDSTLLTGEKHPTTQTVRYTGISPVGATQKRAFSHSRKVHTPTIVAIPKKRPHTHRCHDSEFVCHCDTPHFRAKCGGDRCLQPIKLRRA